MSFAPSYVFLSAIGMNGFLNHTLNNTFCCWCYCCSLQKELCRITTIIFSANHRRFIFERKLHPGLANQQLTAFRTAFLGDDMAGITSSSPTSEGCRYSMELTHPTPILPAKWLYAWSDWFTACWENLINRMT